MEDRVSRRDVLRAVAGAGVAAGVTATAGCFGGEAADVEGWPQFGRDAANTGYVPDDAAVIGDVEAEWVFPEVGQVGSLPEVADGSIYF